MTGTVRALAVVLLAAVVLGACAHKPAADPSAAVASARGVGWSPCDGLTARSVSDLAGEPMTEQTGTTDQPRCAFTPKSKGGAAYDVNYLWFDGGLGSAWESMGDVAGTVTDIDVPGAQAARLVVNATRSAVLVSGFVQTKGLVQSVNAVQLAPYDERTVARATRGLLAELAAHAPDPSS